MIKIKIPNWTLVMFILTIPIAYTDNFVNGFYDFKGFLLASVLEIALVFMGYLLGKNELRGLRK